MEVQTNNTPSLNLFVNTDVFIALIDVADSNHAKAISIYLELERKNVRYLTSNYVAAEAATLINQRIDHASSVEFIKAIRSPTSPFPITWVTSNIEERAIQIFVERTSTCAGFIDCTNMAILDLLHLDGIFSFDKAYRINGYNLVEDLIKKFSE